jgi:hypothetical protein
MKIDHGVYRKVTIALDLVRVVYAGLVPYQRVLATLPVRAMNSARILN